MGQGDFAHFDWTQRIIYATPDAFIQTCQTWSQKAGKDRGSNNVGHCQLQTGGQRSSTLQSLAEVTGYQYTRTLTHANQSGDWYWEFAVSRIACWRTTIWLRAEPMSGVHKFVATSMTLLWWGLMALHALREPGQTLFADTGGDQVCSLMLHIPATWGGLDVVTFAMDWLIFISLHAGKYLTYSSLEAFYHHRWCGSCIMPACTWCQS